MARIATRDAQLVDTVGEASSTNAQASISPHLPISPYISPTSPHQVMMCHFMGLPAFAPDALLRFQLRTALKVRARVRVRARANPKP